MITKKSYEFSHYTVVLLVCVLMFNMELRILLLTLLTKLRLAGGVCVCILDKVFSLICRYCIYQDESVEEKHLLCV